MKQMIHFVHGNGFPSPCYQQMLMPLQARFDCCYIDKIGHSSAFPITENWHFLVQEVIDSIETQASQPVIGLGHSLGGVLTLLAAIERPALFTQVIMLDSPLFGPFKSAFLRVAKQLNFIDKVTPAIHTRTRRTHWNTAEEAKVYLKKRALFKHFTPQCLDDYVTHGLETTPSGVTLRFDRMVEYQIYRTIPHIVPTYEGRLHTPAMVIVGNKTNLVDRFDLNYMQARFGITHCMTQGTHMFPMEHPERIAALIIDLINKDII